MPSLRRRSIFILLYKRIKAFYSFDFLQFERGSFGIRGPYHVPTGMIRLEARLVNLTLKKKNRNLTDFPIALIYGNQNLERVWTVLLRYDFHTIRFTHREFQDF